MPRPDPPASVIIMPKSAALLVHAAAAIHTLTLRDGRFSSMREAALAGFDQILDDKRVDLVVLLQLHGQYDFSGSERLVIGLKQDEMQTLRAAKKRLQTHSKSRLHHRDAVALALMRMARPEFSRDGLIPSPLIWPEGHPLQP
jgi:hypothetical protein